MEQPQSMRHVLLAAGSNLPNGEIPPLENLRIAQLSLASRGWRVLAASTVYRNPAWPPGSDAPDYYNAVFRLAVRRTPHDLLAALHEIEAEAGRRRGARYLSRTLDLDLVAWGDLVLPDALTVRERIAALGADRDAVPDALILPHPRLQERAFVLVPMAEVAPDWRHPVLGRTAAQLRDALAPGEISALMPV